MMMRILLPCGKIEYEPYALDEHKFSFFNGLCCHNRCPKVSQRAKARLLQPMNGTAPVLPAACGWAHVFDGKLCPLEATDLPFQWETWQPRLRGTNKDGEPSYSDELCPKHGTRLEFMKELRTAIEVYMPHFYDYIMMCRGIKVSPPLARPLLHSEVQPSPPAIMCPHEVKVVVN